MGEVVKLPQKRFAEDLNDVINMHMNDGALDLHELENTPAIATIGNGSKCDVLTGPCSCGGWHHKGESRNWTEEYIGYCKLNGKEPGE